MLLAFYNLVKKDASGFIYYWSYDIMLGENNSQSGYYPFIPKTQDQLSR